MRDWLADVFLQRSVRAREQEIQARSPLFYRRGFWGSGPQFRLDIIGAEALVARWTLCVLSVEGDGLHLYPVNRKLDIHHHFQSGALRWFGRPVKYQPGTQ